MHQVDVDGSGNISLEEFMPICFQVMVEITKKANLLAEPKVQ